MGMYSNHRNAHNKLLLLLDDSIQPVPHNLVLCGDSNINTASNDDLSNKYSSFLASRGLLPAIDETTRNRSGTCLDHIYISAHPSLVGVTTAVPQTDSAITRSQSGLLSPLSIR